ncbi:hypothetical protein [Dyadobacter luticola]|uniref:DUF3575 domain-containing protein n=1 Tax=Dyadobacter luticola TaxID=1979387 RepID=A0A5R9L1F9_9BACT|nr:hypothetical protein [Dyadobacter luticola]TLV02248.1 hypothetical protein FEN17_00990 [Dyadobacter luticola]
MTTLFTPLLTKTCRSFTACVCVLLFSVRAFAGEKDSLAVTSNPRFVLSLDSRSTIIAGRPVRINGVLTGLSFGQKHYKITVGYYWLGYDASRKLINWHRKLSQSINLSYYTKTDVQFVSFAYWHPVIRTNKWILSVPAELGIGQETARYRQLSNDSSIRAKNFHFVPAQIGVYAEYRVTNWAGLDAQLGYRNAFSNGAFRKHFSGVYYSYGITLYPGNIYRDVRNYYAKRRE